MTSGILWEGESPVGRAPIVAIATGDTDNRKTGDMIQVWILRQDMSPTDAVRFGHDTAICGQCPMRGEGFRGRACYVNVPQAPNAVWRAYRAGSYGRISGIDLIGRKVRLGAYGDPAMLPLWLVEHVLFYCAGHTGYTHQWATPHGSRFVGMFMASVDTMEAQAKAQRLGWSTFRVGLDHGRDRVGDTLCANEESGLSCADCLACDGHGQRSIYIPAHGYGKDNVPAVVQLKRKQLPLAF